ncbi:MAG: 1,4-alpha-glucan branching protein GlgB [Candidatus Eremiobacteraeota bacterium]|nr:1,4-alpha-glucan branching protein GlgB [Candidatus Eremiobacteraeota bacterium]
MHAQDLALFHAGRLLDAYDKLGAHCVKLDGGSGVRFCTWAPRAQRASVVGDFNDWDGRRHPMQRLDDAGVWETTVTGIGPGSEYKFEIENADNGRLVIKTDPYARAFPARANQNAVVTAPSAYRWGDRDWLELRSRWGWRDAPISIYEVHLSSWRRPAQGVATYEWLAEQLTAYARDLRFTHVELLPIFEHPLDESLGYQVTGYYAPTSRFGPPDAFRAFVDACHRAGIGVILDWVPLHFPKDMWGLAEFDGAPLYERDDPAMAEHPQWHTLIFNYGQPEVRNFLLSNALFWLREFHIDGLRVDAVSSMLFLDDARSGSFRPNPLGGRENLPAVRFLRETNVHIARTMPDVFTIAEESTSWPRVSQPVPRGGLGFSMRWNMGWVHDTLQYCAVPCAERPGAHHHLTFERLYAKNEHFVLALSHDEVSTSTGSLVSKMAGDAAQRFAGLRLLLTFHATYPGKKLLFMGDEFGQDGPWEPRGELDWTELEEPAHAGVLDAVRDLNTLYCDLPALHAVDAGHTGFRWLAADDAAHSVISYVRSAGEALAVVVLNFSCTNYDEYVVGVPRSGTYDIVFDSDAGRYGGAGRHRARQIPSVDQPSMGCEHSVTLSLAALSGVVLVPA